MIFFRKAFLIILLSSHTSLLGHYDWTKHVPPDARQYIPESAKESATKQSSATYYGPTNLKNQDYAKNLTVMGPATLDGVAIEGEMYCNGPLNAQRSSFGLLRVNGPVTLNESTVSGDTSINGPLHAKDSQFSSISIATNTFTLKNSTVSGNILVRRNRPFGSQVLILENTVVQGTITFEANQGKVVFVGNSKADRIIGAMKYKQ